MDFTQLSDAALQLVSAPSPTGREGPALEVAESLLMRAGLRVERIAVDAGRHDLLACAGRPRALLVTHLDTVPGDLPVSVHGGVLSGRGACDAKGIAAAMIAAAARLVDAGEDGVGVLLTVGEETTSDGALAARAFLEARADEYPVESLLVGEPTGGRWAAAHPSVVTARLRATGQSAHSAFPAAGRSAVHALLEALSRLRAEPWPVDDVLGPTLLNVGRLEGGERANVVAASAEADVMLRSGASASELVGRAAALLDGDVALEITCRSDAVRFRVPTGETGTPVPFASDAPFLARPGLSLALFGPGEIHHAHSDDEHVRLDDLESAARTYAEWLTAARTVVELAS